MPARPGASLLLLCLFLAAVCGLSTFLDRLSASARTSAANDKITQGQLRILDSQGKPGGLCPLKHTDVKAEVSGFLARVTLTQEFHNPMGEKIEAVYLFPLPPRSAVDQLTMDVGGRVIRAEIKRREEAQRLFAQARTEGRVAALLDQERPNLFTQAVTNISPGASVKVTISYVETLPYEDGVYEFTFPMVVGPRYIPGKTKPGDEPEDGKQAAAETDQVPDGARITPSHMPTGMRPGHDVSLEITIDTGVPLEQIASELHEIEVDRDGAQDVTPKELVFVLDTSGSMGGLPIETAKRVMRLALDGLYEHDTFNLITFAGDTHILFDKPVPATKENLRKANQLLEGKSGDGGTEMMKAIRAALADTDTQDHIRVVCFLTDGEVGNDLEIINEVQRHPKARVFSFGIGNSVNRFLLDKMAEQGRGEAEYVFLNRGDRSGDEAAAVAAKRFYERVRAPLLTDISVDWNGLPVEDVYPKRLPDLFSAKPLFITGRYTGAASGVMRLRGKAAGADFLREINVDLPESEERHDALASLWARIRIDDLMAQDYRGLQAGNMRKDVKEEITRLGLDYRLMTQFTSFIAVDEVVAAPGEAPRRIEVPVAAPNGTIIPANGIYETVTLTASASTISVSSSEIAATIEHRRLEELPLNMRQPTELAKLAPGAAPT
jgi:Ca-activated chloride channel homolog